MSYQATTWVLEWSRSKLAPRLVLLSIASHANRDGEQSWPSIDTIAHEARVSARHAQRCIRELQAMGELEVEWNAGPKGANKYRLPLMSQPGLPLINPAMPLKGGDKLSGVAKCRGGDPGVAPGGDKSGMSPLTNPTEGGDSRVTRTVLKPSIEPSRARDRDDLTVAIARRILAVLGQDQLPADARRTILPLEDWLARGADGDTDILPTIESVVARQRAADPSWRPHSWHEFTDPIALAMAARASGQAGEDVHAGP